MTTTLRNLLAAIICANVLLMIALVATVPAQDDPVAAAIELFNAGQDAHEKGDLLKAIELYRSALKQLPEFPEAEYQMASAFLSLGRKQEAEQGFRRAIELRQDWPLPISALGALLLDKGEFAESELLLKKAIDSDAQNFGAFSALTELKLRTKADPKELAELLTKVRNLASKANPTSSIWVARAALERTLGDVASAKSSVGRALEIDPASRSAIVERAEIALVSNDASGALADAEILARSVPASAVYRFLLARAQAASGTVDAAIATLDSIEQPTSEMADFRSRLKSATNVDTAELEKQLETSPNNEAVLGRLCGLLRTSNPGKALEYCRRAYDVAPRNLDYVIGFGAALVQAKRFDAAVNILTQVTNAAPDNFTARANLAVALFELKRYPEAKDQYRWITERRPENAIAHYFLGIIHDQLKEYPDAMANYQRFLKLADATQFKLEIEKVNLRLPSLQGQLKKK